MSRAELFEQRLAEATQVLASLDSPAIRAGLERAVDLLVAALAADGRVLLCGNGGSAADAQHLAAELVGRFQLERRPLAAVALADNVAATTAIGNDYAFDEIFERPVRGLGRPGDVLIGLTTSGRSVNVERALHAARDVGLATIAFVGPADSPVARAADVVLGVDGPSTARIQEAHKFLGHTLFEMVERETCGP